MFDRVNDNEALLECCTPDVDAIDIITVADLANSISETTLVYRSTAIPLVSICCEWRAYQPMHTERRKEEVSACTRSGRGR